MALDQKKYEHKHKAILRDVRPLRTRIADSISTPNFAIVTFIMAGPRPLYLDVSPSF